MTETRTESDLSLPEFLSARARHASDTRLAMDVACGFIVAVLAAAWHGPGWHLITSAAACFLGYGAWGITDRELTERTGTSGRGVAVLRAARIAAAIVGVVAAVALCFGGLYVVLGSPGHG